MTDRWRDAEADGRGDRADRYPRPHQRHRRSSRRRALTPEERTYRLARRRANAKLRFLTHLLVYLSVCAFLSIVSPRSALITAFGWGIGLAIHYFFVMVAPGLRERLIEAEVRREVDAGITRERQNLENRHARSLEQLSAAIAHEIRNPISAAKSLVQQMGEDPSSGESVGYASVALEELDRVERSISHLLRYAREEELDLAPIRLRDVVESSLEAFRDRVSRSGVALTQEFDSDGPMMGDAEKLRRVLINLVGNALDALEASATPDPAISVAVGGNLAGTGVWVRVRDNGPGIDPNVLETVFSPFYTSKEDGTGLGLAISKKLVDAHGGVIEASAKPGAGAEFVISFPTRSERTS